MAPPPLRSFLVAALLLVSAGFVFMSMHGLSFSPARSLDPSDRHAEVVKRSQSSVDQLKKKQEGQEEEEEVSTSGKYRHHHTHQLLSHNVQKCPKHSPYFEIHPPVMTANFTAHINYMSHKINSKKWSSIPMHRVDLEQCGRDTPECAFWSCFPPTTAKEQHQKEKERDEKKDDAEEEEEKESSSTSSTITALKKCCYEHKALRDTAFWVIGQLEEHNIRYFLSTGSALGAIRHNGVIIPWDTDVDMVIFPTDAHRAKELFKSKKKEHYYQRDPQGKPMFWVHHSKNGRPAGGPHVEVFYEADYTNHPKELLPLQNCSFYGRRVSCPRTDMFGVWFPSGWRRYGGDHYHNDGRCTLYDRGQRIEKKHC